VGTHNCSLTVNKSAILGQELVPICMLVLIFWLSTEINKQYELLYSFKNIEMHVFNTHLLENIKSTSVH
jgi:hypothetical protein